MSETKKKRWQAKQEFRSTHKQAEEPLLSERERKYDPSASAEDCLADLRDLQERNPDTFITRRFYRKHGKYSDSTWDTRFGTFAEFRRQARLELSRGQSALEKQIAKHASLDTRRGFMETEVLPWVGKYEKDHTGRWQTMIVASDFHDKDMDPFVYSVFLDTCKRVQPSIVCLAGDVYDNYEFSRFDKDPRHWDAAGRLAFVRDEIYAPLRKAVPNAQIDLIVGNHELHLLRHMSERTPELRTILSDFMGLTMADMFGLPQFEINLISRSDLAAFNARDSASEVAKNSKIYFDSVLVDHYPDERFECGISWNAGHTHKPFLRVKMNRARGRITGVTNGCMAKTINSYNPKDDNSNSFTIWHIDTVTRATIAEPILFCDNAVMVGGKRYERG